MKTAGLLLGWMREGEVKRVCLVDGVNLVDVRVCFVVVCEFFLSGDLFCFRWFLSAFLKMSYGD